MSLGLQVRKLTADEVQALQNKGKGTRKLTEELYDSILSEYSVGEYGEATLDEADNRLTVRNRLKAAARRRNMGIEFRRTTGDLLRFQIVKHSENIGAPKISRKAAAPEPPPPPEPVKRKGGRPKKSA